ncbi:MAG: HlyD family secretion protein, partial [Rhodobacteraceae bacterium]|nr:HlyD family secretion protein [Paracoccaceae bacterium]
MNDAGKPGSYVEADAGDVQPERRRFRKRLMALAPLMLFIAGAAYLWSGRFVATDNAYIRADIVNISPEVSGTVVDVLVAENERVTRGQPLLRLDDKNYRIMLVAAEAVAKNTAADIEADRLDYSEHLNDLRIVQSELEFAQRQYERQQKLVKSSAGAEAARDEAERALKVARDRVALTRNQIDESLARLFGDPEISLEQHPKYQEALAQEELARLQIERSVVKAPIDGIVSHLPKVGDYARTGVSTLTLVSDSNVWVEANYKETELTNLHAGQVAEIEIDTYPGRAWTGHVESISQAAGSEFALLPAQNATGNWVKVVQRVP